LAKIDKKHVNDFGWSMSIRQISTMI